MEKDIVIRLDHVTKIYRLFDKPTDRIKEAIHPFHKRYSRDFYALNDVNLEVRRGDTVGFIGRNGAGKSTILKLITGVLTPTTGEITIHGRIASLLELGAGFNPEMTGTENIYMNGTIMGLTRQQMDERLDDIVGFADIGDFIHQPVKTYSSGMFARLAFAVNAFVEPDILIVDEALSVGDAFFQAKCIHKMRNLLDTGVTVLFVSHDWSAVKALCKRGVFVENGKVLLDGTADEAVEAYRKRQLSVRQEDQGRAEPLSLEERGISADALKAPVHQAGKCAASWFRPSAAFVQAAAYQRFQSGKASFVNVVLLDRSGNQIQEVTYEQDVTLRMAVAIQQALPLAGTGYHIRTEDGVDLVYTDAHIEGDCGLIKDARAGERYLLDWHFRVSLREGKYNIAVVLSIPLALQFREVECCDFIPCAVQFTVGRNEKEMGGYVHWPSTVEIEKVEAENEPFAEIEKQ